MECARDSYNHREMSSFQKKATITLIEKQGKDRSLIENWRSISLINVDAKIISKVITVRLKRFYQILYITIKQDMLKIVIYKVRQFGLSSILLNLQAPRIFLVF